MNMPGFPEAMAVLDMRGYGQYEARDVAAAVLTAAIPAILAAAFADLADACAEDGFFGPELALYLDTMSAEIRERTTQHV